MAKKKNQPAIKTVETKFTEIRFSTRELQEMKGKYVASPVCKIWKEDFLDEDTGEVVSIERRERLIERGCRIEGDILANIQFYLSAGDIDEIEVSNQRREAFLTDYDGWLCPWSVKAKVEGKKCVFLLYAVSANSALEIAKDYIEMNFKGGFQFFGVKTFESCIFINDNLIRPDEEKPEGRDFYKIDVDVICDDEVQTQTFVMQGKDADTCMILIKDWISKKKKKEGNCDEVSFTTTLKCAGLIPCFRLISREFSEAHEAMQESMKK